MHYSVLVVVSNDRLNCARNLAVAALQADDSLSEDEREERCEHLDTILGRAELAQPIIAEMLDPYHEESHEIPLCRDQEILDLLGEVVVADNYISKTYLGPGHEGKTNREALEACFASGFGVENPEPQMREFLERRGKSWEDSSLEDKMAWWFGYEWLTDHPDYPEGCWGDRQNPNGEWDYWLVGGRYRERLRVTEAGRGLALTGDYRNRVVEHVHSPTCCMALREDLDLETEEEEYRQNFENVWKLYNNLKDSNYEPSDKDERRVLFTILRHEGVEVTWGMDPQPPSKGYTRPELEELIGYQLRRALYYVLDGNGWHRRFELAYSVPIESERDWLVNFKDRFLVDGHPHDLMVAVDIHC